MSKLNGLVTLVILASILTGGAIGIEIGYWLYEKENNKTLNLSTERLTYQNIKLKLERDECFLFATELIKQQTQPKENIEWY